jgi:hypothetical protein
LNTDSVSLNPGSFARYEKSSRRCLSFSDRHRSLRSGSVGYPPNE